MAENGKGSWSRGSTTACGGGEESLKKEDGNECEEEIRTCCVINIHIVCNHFCLYDRDKT